MQLRVGVTTATSPRWIEAVMADFNSFLQDHANCERKASAMAMSFVAKCPDRVEIIGELIDTALEELEHFKDVYNIMEQRGIMLSQEMEEDAYVKKLISVCRSGRNERFLDRMILASIFESRGAERFRIIYENTEDKTLKAFYHRLWATEAKHGEIYVKLALNYFDESTIYKRLNELNEEEGRVIDNLPFRAALH